MLHFSERQETITKHKSGIMIDFDRYQTTKEQEINSGHFSLLTRSLSKLLSDNLDFKNVTENGDFIYRIFYIRKPAVVLDKNNSKETAVYKDGFHILIPQIQVTKGFKKYLLQELNAKGIIKAIFKDISQNVQAPEDMLDKASASNPVHFYGHSKPNKPCYLLTDVHEVSMHFDGDMDRQAMKLSDIDPDLNMTYELSLSFYLDKINGKPTWLKKCNFDYKLELETKIKILVEKNDKNILKEDELFATDNSVNILTLSDANAAYLKELLELLHPSFTQEYEKWFKVICAIAHTSTRYKDLAIHFSQRCPRAWSPAEFDRVWDEACNNNFNRVPVTKRSIMHWARESSPEKYKQLSTENYYYKLAKSVYENEGRVEHYIAAKTLHAMIGDKFVVDVQHNDATGKNGYCWYEFVLPGQAMKRGEVFKWRKELEPDNVHLFISEHLPKVYREIVQSIKDKKEEADNEALAKYWSNVEKTFKNYASKLNNNGFQIGIVRQAQFLFRQRGFAEELDSYEDIIGVGNGILKIGIKPELIKGFHEYRISKFTETNYVPFNKNNHHVKTLLNAFKDIFPERDVYKFMLYLAATGLDAKECAGIITLCVGGGQNGKSFFAKMVHNTLGNQYCAIGKSTLLTSTSEKSENANSAQMQTRDKRWMYYDEFNKSECINVARLKSLINPGWQSGRDLNAKQTNFKNTCNPVALSNYDFIIETVDHGTWRRIYYYKNKVKFCTNPNPDNPYEKKENRKFMYEYTNDPEYKQAMLSIMVHYYSKLCSKYGNDIKNIPVPTIVVETEEFRNRQDSLNKFITQMIVKSPESPDIGVPTIAAKYIDWYIRNINKTVTFTAMDVQTQLENSSIHRFLELRGNVKWLKEHRLKDCIEEPLRENETALSATEIKITNVTDTEKVKPPKIIVKEKCDFAEDVENNSPSYIQETKDNLVIDQAVNDEVFDLISNFKE